MLESRTLDSIQGKLYEQSPLEFSDCQHVYLLSYPNRQTGGRARRVKNSLTPYTMVQIFISVKFTTSLLAFARRAISISRQIQLINLACKFEVFRTDCNWDFLGQKKCNNEKKWNSLLACTYARPILIRLNHTPNFYIRVEKLTMYIDAKLDRLP